MKVEPFRISILVYGLIIMSAFTATAQKGTAEAGFYPLGYSGGTWSGEVTAFDNQLRTLTLTYSKVNKTETFVAHIPDAPYHQASDPNNLTVIEFPYDKAAKFQRYKYANLRAGGSGFIAPLNDVKSIPNPDPSKIITDFSNFKNLRIMVFYTPRERETNGAKEKYNDVWRIKVLPKEK